jgi:hypothetical protein
MDERPGCAETRELLPELAAGVAAGDERAHALRHLSGCIHCRRELDAMVAVLDELVTLVPPVEPPAGFESAVLARVAPSRSRWWRRRALRLATAAVLAVAIGVGIGAATMTQATADDRRIASAYRRTLHTANGRYLAARRLNAPDASDHGVVFAYQGKPSWVFIVLEYGVVGASYQVRLVTVDGRDRPIGKIDVTSGESSWGVAIDVDVAQVAQVRLSGAAVAPLTAAFR